MRRVPEVHEEHVLFQIQGGEKFILQAGEPAFDVWKMVK